MLFFNDVSISSFPGLMVEDIRVSPIQYAPLARQRPIRFGAEFVRISGGSRTVAVTFAVLEQDREARAMLLMDVRKWARSVDIGKLQVTGYPDMHLMAGCTEFSEHSSRQWWEDSLKVVFTAYEPYWLSDDEKSVPCGTDVLIAGSAPPKMRIVRTLSSAASNQSWSDGTDTITLSSVPAGRLTIDLDRQTIDVDGQSVMSGFTFGSSFIRPKIGQMNISGAGTVIWQERWE